MTHKATYADLYERARYSEEKVISQLFHLFEEQFTMLRRAIEGKAQTKLIEGDKIFFSLFGQLLDEINTNREKYLIEEPCSERGVVAGLLLPFQGCELKNDSVVSLIYQRMLPLYSIYATMGGRQRQILEIVKGLEEENAKKEGRIEELREMISRYEKKRIKDGDPLVHEYIRTCEEEDTTKPTAEQLSKVTDISRSEWTKKLNNPGFILQLGDEIKKKPNLAKTKEKREFWIKANVEVENLAAKCSARINQKKRMVPYYDNLPDENGFNPDEINLTDDFDGPEQEE